MKSGFALLEHSWRRYRTLLLMMAGVIAGFQVLFCIAAVTLQESDTFGPLLSLIPAPIREALGPGLITMVSFRGLACLGFFHIAVLGTLIGLMIAVATEPAAEIETGFVDLVLSHPIPRRRVIFRTMIMLAGSTLAVLSAMGAGSLIGILWFAPEGMVRSTLNLVLALLANLALLMLAWGAIALALASVARRRGIPIAVAGLLVLASYLVDYMARFWEPAKRAAWLCPFHYYQPVELIGGAGLPARNLLILSAIAAGGFGIAVMVFSRRDL